MKWFNDLYSDIFVSPDYEYGPFDISQSELRILGYGRLATLEPSPIFTESKKYQGKANAPPLFLGKDSSGKWHLRD